MNDDPYARMGCLMYLRMTAWYVFLFFVSFTLVCCCAGAIL